MGSPRYGTKAYKNKLLATKTAKADKWGGAWKRSPKVAKLIRQVRAEARKDYQTELDNLGRSGQSLRAEVDQLRRRSNK